MSPTMSASSSAFVAHDAHVESASRVHTGTAASAAIFTSTDGKRGEREGKGVKSLNPFAHPGDTRGGRF